MRYFLTFILAIIFEVSFAQNFSYPSLKSKGQSLIDFVPGDWTILDSAYGDLNNDRVKDAAIILQYKDSITLVSNEEDTVLTQPRILVILFKNRINNSLELIEQNNSFILKHDNSAMDDPYQELLINKAVLELKFNLFYNMGSWYVTSAAYKFRYQQGQFVLIGTDKFSIHRATLDFENYSYNFLTKKRSLTKGNYSTGTKKTTWKALNISSHKTLRSFAKPFSWEVENDIFL